MSQQALHQLFIQEPSTQDESSGLASAIHSTRVAAHLQVLAGKLSPAMQVPLNLLGAGPNTTLPLPSFGNSRSEKEGPSGQ
jgi:hypothetical protein